jgi:hypothetical protein
MEKYNEEKEEKSIKLGGRCGVIFTSEVKSGQIRQAYLREVCIESECHASIVIFVLTIQAISSLPICSALETDCVKVHDLILAWQSLLMHNSVLRMHHP